MQVGRYFTYHFISEKVTRLVSKHPSSLGLKTKPTMQQALTQLYFQEPRLMQTMDCTIMAEELFWMQNSRVALFPESTDVLDKLKAGKYDIKNAAGFSMPYESFVLLFPAGFMIAGQQAQGTLVTWMRHTDREEKIFNPFMKYISQPDLPIRYSGEDTAALNEYTLMISYPIFSMPGNPNDPAETRVGCARAAIPRALIPELLSCANGAEFQGILGRYNQTRTMAEFDLNSEDAEYQFQLFRLLATMGIYTSAFGGALKEGFPGNRPKFLEPKDIPKFRDVTLQIGSSHTSPHSHYRTWHIRQLNDERFYRGEYAKMEPGSRMVFVREAYVGHDVEAETIVDVDKKGA